MSYIKRLQSKNNVAATGYLAAANGKPIETNPYKKNNPFREWWNTGWKDYHSEKSRDCH